MPSFLKTKISLRQIELLTVALPQKETFRSAIGFRSERQALLVKWFDGDRNYGIGECSCRPDPYFNGEFVSGAIEVIEKFIAPSLTPQMTVQQLHTLAQKVRGWPFTVAALTDAAFDLLRRNGEKDLLDLYPANRIDNIPVGISLGLFESERAALERVEKAVDQAYRRIKMKVAPGMNPQTVIAIRETYPDLYLGLDANGSFSPDDKLLLAQLSEARPNMLEQPFPPNRLDWVRWLKEQFPTFAVCLDESITCLGDLITAQKMGAIDELNIKPGRVGGQIETTHILDYCRDNQIPAWVGGMFESGIGRYANLRVAAFLDRAKAHDLSPSSRYFKKDLVHFPLEMTDGLISIAQDQPVKIDEDAIQIFLKSRSILQIS